MVRTLFVTLLALTATSTGPATAAQTVDTAPSPRHLVVDDDRSQCADADFTTIQEAVDAAAPGDVVRVCPGLYTKTTGLDGPLVTVDKPLTLRGEPETIEGVDCFASTYSPPDPNRQVVIQAPSSSTTQPPVLLRADGVTLQGFVFQGVTLDTGRWALETSPEHSGYRVAHNLFQSNLIGVRFGSSGNVPSQFDHNCIRDNRWGFTTGFDHFVENARVHHNSTFRQLQAAYELVRPTTVPHSTVDVTFDHNVSRRDGGNFGAYHLVSTLQTTVSQNIVEAATRRAIHLDGGNEVLRILDNILEGQAAGIAQASNPLPPPNKHVEIRGNIITGGTSAGIGMGIGALNKSTIAENVVTGSTGEGIALIVGNTDNVVSGNVVTGSTRNGIFAGAGATSNTFVGNEMHGNGAVPGTADARDDTDPVTSDGVQLLNTWTANVCETDIPAGAICGAGVG